MLVETVKVMLNGVYLEEGLDYLLAHKHGESRVELRRAPAPGDTLVVLRVPARASAAAPHHAPQVHDDVPPYEHLPREVKDNIAPSNGPPPSARWCIRAPRLPRRPATSTSRLA